MFDPKVKKNTKNLKMKVVNCRQKMIDEYFTLSKRNVLHFPRRE